ncbi:MAG: hypothetical protein ABIZ50_08575 [Solirubrobacterales bacterium]
MVYPRRLLAEIYPPQPAIPKFELIGARPEPIGLDRVLTGAELIAGPHLGEIAAWPNGQEDRALARYLELYSLALAWVETTDSDSGTRRIDGGLQVAWRAPRIGPRTSEVAAQVDGGVASLLIRARYAESKPRGRAEVFVEVSPTGSPERAVFWLTDGALADAAARLRSCIAANTTGTPRRGYVEC